MQAIQSVISFMQNLGAACMMPIFVFIIGLVVRVPLKQLLKASVTVGCGFIGTFMVMDLLAKYIGPISTGLVEKFNLSLDVIDVGWPVTGSFAWAVPIAPLIFVGVFALNILLIVVGFTRTLDVDIWNYWGLHAGRRHGLLLHQQCDLWRSGRPDHRCRHLPSGRLCGTCHPAHLSWH